VLLAEAQLRSNQLEQAGISLAKAKQLDPANPGIWFAEGSLALRASKPNEAIGLLEQGLKLDKRNAGAYFDLGNARILLGQSGQALAAFERASSLRKGFWEALNNQGLVLFEQGNSKAAISRWREVLKIKPDAAEPTLALAASLFANGPENRSEAIELVGKALDTEPNYVLDSHQKGAALGTEAAQHHRELFKLPNSNQWWIGPLPMPAQRAKEATRSEWRGLDSICRLSRNLLPQTPTPDGRGAIRRIHRTGQRRPHRTDCAAPGDAALLPRIRHERDRW
jgi:Putative Zn-dependent protease, contains TPR repeats